MIQTNNVTNGSNVIISTKNKYNDDPLSITLPYASYAMDNLVHNVITTSNPFLCHFFGNQQ